MHKANFLVSIIVPVYNEEKNVVLFYETILPIISKYKYEIIFVDDGSTDNTFNTLKTIVKGDNSIKLLSFSRNFGHQMALSAGYSESKGDCAITIDVDLQDPPGLITDMIVKWQEGYDIVYAKRIQRDESFFKKTTAMLFYKFINLLSDIPIPTDVGDFRLVDKKVVNFLNSTPEKMRFLRGLVAWTGYNAAYVDFVRKERKVGETHYPLSKMIKFAIEGIISFSIKPLRFATFFGFLTSSVGILGIIYAMYRRLFMPSEFWVTGWTALFVAVVFFGGVQLITIGIIGEYIAKIYTEIQGRPTYLIKEKVNI
jgi:polyisoprenyl-phosphate glycosyltransferase